MSDPVLLRMDGPVAFVSFNRPERHNAVDDATADLLARILEDLHGRSDVRVVVLRGEGRSFSSGRDTSVLGHRAKGESDYEFVAEAQRRIRLISTMPVPVIAALKGAVIGGSFERALHCDLRIAASDAVMALPEVSHGLVPDTGGVARLFAMAGPSITKDMVLTGRRITADEALRYGIVSRVVAPEELDDVVAAVAHELAKAPPFAVRMARQLVDELWADRAERSMREELIAQALCFASEDRAELKAARAEGREPRFRGR